MIRGTQQHRKEGIVCGASANAPTPIGKTAAQNHGSERLLDSGGYTDAPASSDRRASKLEVSGERLGAFARRSEDSHNQQRIPVGVEAVRLIPAAYQPEPLGEVAKYPLGECGHSPLNLDRQAARHIVSRKQRTATQPATIGVESRGLGADHPNQNIAVELLDHPEEEDERVVVQVLREWIASARARRVARV